MLLQGASSLEELCRKPLQEIEQEWLNQIDSSRLPRNTQELLEYRVWLGEYFTNRRHNKTPLPWIGLQYDVQGDTVMIRDVEYHSPAEDAGLQPGDMIKTIDDIVLTAQNAWKLSSVVHHKQRGETVFLAVERNGSTMVRQISVKVEACFRNPGCLTE